MKNELELAPYIDDITWALKNDIESQKIEAELKNYLDNFDLPIDEAKRCVLKKFGGDPRQLGRVVDKTIKDLVADENSVNLLCRVLYIDEKDISVDGKTKNIVFGILGDPTGTVPFTAWHDLNCEKGNVIRIYNAYTRSWNDKVQVNLGDRTHVRVLPPDTLPKTVQNDAEQECKVNAFRDGLRYISTTIRILEISEQVIKIKDDQKKIFRGIAADETGKCRFAAWSDFKLNISDVIRITGGYIRSWRGVPELQLNGEANIEKLSDETLPSLEQLDENKVFTIRTLKQLGGACCVNVEGVVLDIRPTSGLIKRCPECNRVLQNESCMVHGKVNGELDLRVKGVLDDGTGAITMVLAKEITEKILGLDVEGCISRAKETMRFDVIYDDIVKKLLARPICVSGTVLSDEFGFMLIGDDAKIIEPRIKEQALGLLDQLGIEINNEVWNNDIP